MTEDRWLSQSKNIPEKNKRRKETSSTFPMRQTHPPFITSSLFHKVRACSRAGSQLPSLIE